MPKSSIPRPSIEIHRSEFKNIIFILTDCISLAWKNGSIAQTIYEWGKNNHVTIMQMLPNRIWSGTALNDTIDVYLHATEQGQNNSNLICYDQALELDHYSEVFVPVITLDSQSFHIWSRFITVTENTWIPGVLFNKNNFDNSFLFDAEKVEQDISANERVKLFLATASPKAQKLAVYLSAAPLTLPVIRLIQKIMLPDSNQEHLAEFFLGGLIKRVSESWQEDPNIILYDFHDGVRDILQNTIIAPKAMKVINIVSNYIEQKCGKGENIVFLACIGDDNSNEILKDENLRPFARIRTNILIKFGYLKNKRKNEPIYIIQNSSCLNEKFIGAIESEFDKHEYLITLKQYLKNPKDTDIKKISTLYDRILSPFDQLSSLKSPKKFSSDLTYKYYLKRIISDIIYITGFERYYLVSEREAQSFQFDIQHFHFNNNIELVNKCYFKIIGLHSLPYDDKDVKDVFKMILELYPNKDRSENCRIIFVHAQHEWKDTFSAKKISIGSILCFQDIRLEYYLAHYDNTLINNPELIEIFQLNDYEKNNGSSYLDPMYCLRNLKEKIFEDYFSFAHGNANLNNIIFHNNSSSKILNKSNVQQLKEYNQKKIDIDQSLRNFQDKMSEDYFSIAHGDMNLNNIISHNNSSLKQSTKSNIYQSAEDEQKKIDIDQIDNLTVKLIDLSSSAEDYPLTYDMVTLEVEIKNQILIGYVKDFCGKSHEAFIYLSLKIERYLNSNTFEVVDYRNIAKQIDYEDLLLYKGYNQISSLITFICKIRKRAYEMYKRINETDNFQKLYLQQLFFYCLKTLSYNSDERSEKCWATVSAIVAATEIFQ